MFRSAVTSSVTESDAGDVGRLPHEFADGGAFHREIVLETADLFPQLGDGAEQAAQFSVEAYDGDRMPSRLD